MDKGLQKRKDVLKNEMEYVVDSTLKNKYKELTNDYVYKENI